MRRPIQIVLGWVGLVGMVGLAGCGAGGLLTKKETVRVNLGPDLFQPRGGAQEDYGAVEGYVYINTSAGGELQIFASPGEVPGGGWTPLAGATVELREANGERHFVETDRKGFFHLVAPASLPSTNLEVTARHGSHQVQKEMPAEPIPVRRSFFRRRVKIAPKDVPDYVEVKVRRVSLQATITNDGLVPARGTLFYATEGEDAAAGAGGIDADKVQELAVPFFLLANPQDPTDTILDPGESWLLEEEQIQDFKQRPPGTPPGPSLNDLLLQAMNQRDPVYVYIYGLVEPENGNVSVRNVEVTARVEGGIDLF